MADYFGIEEALTEDLSSRRLLIRPTVENLEIISEAGNCIMDEKDPTLPRDIASYNERVIVPGINSGKIGDGVKTKFDDRKMRLGQLYIADGKLYLGFGISYYGEFKVPFGRTDQENIILQDKGLAEHRERYAFFPRNPGIAALVISKDGSAFIGRKIGDDAGLWAAVAGHLKFNQDPTQVRLEDSVYMELEEEFGLDKKSIKKLSLVGGYNNPIRGDMDFAYIAQSDAPNSYFESGKWKSKVSEREHKDLVGLHSMADVQKLLSKGLVGDDKKEYGIGYSTRGALQSLRPSEIK